MALATPFDTIAQDYDRTFSSSAIGTRMRAAAWRRLDAAFRPGERVLELNCGTGEDAIHLAERGVRVLATDVSPAMVELTRAKAERAGLAGLVECRCLAIEQLGDLRAGPFDGAVSNFGGLNCVTDLPAAGRALAAAVRPGGRVLLGVMGPLVPWEMAWFVAHGEPRKALRRLRPGGTPWRGLTVRYPSIRRLRRALAGDFSVRRVAAIGALVPPTFAEAWASRHPRLLDALDRWERRWERIPPLPWLADHYLIEFDRR